MVGHPSIGAALEALLRIEDRYEVRRAQSLDQAGANINGWTPELALVDGVLVETGSKEALPMPVIVLSGTAADGARLSAGLAAGHGWLRKDATAEELRSAIEHALRGRAAPRPNTAVIGAVVLALLAIAVGVTFYVLGIRI